MTTQDFDLVQELNDTTIFGQVKTRSLEDYDHDGLDGEDADILLGLVRWGDLKVPDRIFPAPAKALARI